MSLSIFCYYPNISSFLPPKHLAMSQQAFGIMISLSIFWYYHDNLILPWYIKISNSCTLSYNVHPGKHLILLYSWSFSCYSMLIHWLVHSHMASNNETVSCQMPWVGSIAKTMTSNRKQFTVTCEMLTAVARDRWNRSTVFKFCLCFVLLYNKSLNDWSRGEQWILFPENLNVSRDEV